MSRVRIRHVSESRIEYSVRGRERRPTGNGLFANDRGNRRRTRETRLLRVFIWAATWRRIRDAECSYGGEQRTRFVFFGFFLTVFVFLSTVNDDDGGGGGGKLHSARVVANRKTRAFVRSGNERLIYDSRTIFFSLLRALYITPGVQSPGGDGLLRLNLPFA